MGADNPLAGVLPEEFSSIEWTPTLPTVASPSWVGGDSLFFEGHTPGGVPLLVRSLRPAAAIRVDCAAMFAAMEAAGSAGLAPAVLFHDASHGVCVQEKLDDSWQIATLYRLLDPDAWRASLRARRKFRELAPDLPCVSVFDQVATLLAYARDNVVEIPSVAHEVIAAVEEARACVHGGPEPLPCHGDGAVSNVMLCAGEARLVGWTQSGRMDPLEEVGSVLTELAPFVADAATVFEAAWGDRDPLAFARARLYGLADDLRWGLIGSCARALQPDSPIEYQRYGHWRLFKARFAVAGGQVARWMREAS
jgi:Phosphotransferase enzyme family